MAEPGQGAGMFSQISWPYLNLRGQIIYAHQLLLAPFPIFRPSPIHVSYTLQSQFSDNFGLRNNCH